MVIDVLSSSIPLTRAQISDALGAGSMICWLGAQLPQIVHNYNLKSCHGLALPFLFNWFLGDFSNLVGCILTHQLPFQTYLAFYFCAVDLTLCWQFWYYYHPLKPDPALAHRARSRAASTGTLNARVSSERPPHHYRNLSVVAASVAATAALAAHQDEYHHIHGRGHRSLQARSSSTQRDASIQPEESALSDSFHSERIPYRTRRISWSNDPMPSASRVHNMTRSAILPHPHSQLTDPRTITDGLPRGRSSRRDGSTIPEQDPIHRRTPKTSRHGSNLVLMGAWALFGIGTLVGVSHHPSTHVGRVLVPAPAPVASYLPLTQHLHVEPSPNPSPLISLLAAEDLPHHELPHESPSMERILGRIFAWLCTALYLTSRLPQIWKNYVRKSVEGLSMYLFVFAFLGNVFYVSSILSSPNLLRPPPISTDFMRESIPYLLGSAGTLMFDITIVAQSFIYRRKTKRHTTSSHTRAVSDEEASLLRDPDNQGPRHSADE